MNALLSDSRENICAAPRRRTIAVPTSPRRRKEMNHLRKAI